MRDASLTTSSVPRPVILTLGVICGVLVAATAFMWLHYGTAVFYEIIAAGIAMCL